MQNFFKILKDLIKSLALQIGSQIDYQNLGLQSEFNSLQMKSNLNLLEKAFIAKWFQECRGPELSEN